MAQLITQPLDSIGDLSWLEAHWGSPVKRLFWIRGVPAHQARGGHRHPSGHMALCCVRGSVEVYVQTVRRDQGYRLQTATEYLLLAPQDWRLMYKFSVDAVLLVLAQQPYALTHYIDEPYRPLVCAQLDGLLTESPHALLLAGLLDRPGKNAPHKQYRDGPIQTSGQCTLESAEIPFFG